MEQIINFCKTAADYVLANNLDGIDINLKILSGGQKTTDALIECTKEIRNKLPVNKGYLLTHAP